MSLLHLRAVAKSYARGGRANPVIRDASLVVEPGSLVAVYGDRGAGKTTLLRLAAGFEQPDAGTVSVVGCRLDTLSRRQLLSLRRDSLGWVDGDGPHDSGLAMETYVALPLYRAMGRRQARRRALRALAAVDAQSYAEACWDELSDTQRTLCAIAQASIRTPRLLMADDPTAGLGPRDRERICQMLRAIAEESGLGVLMTVPEAAATLRSHVTKALVAGRLLSSASDQDDDNCADVVDLATRRSA